MLLSIQLDFKYYRYISIKMILIKLYFQNLAKNFNVLC